MRTLRPRAISVAACLIAAGISSGPATAEPTPPRGRIVAMSVNEPWVDAPAQTQTRWGGELFLATSRPCIGANVYKDLTVIAATPDEADKVWYTDGIVGTSPWRVLGHDVKELANVAPLAPQVDPVDPRLTSKIAIAGTYTVELTCVARQTGAVVATFVGELRVGDRAMIDVAGARQIATRKVTLGVEEVWEGEGSHRRVVQVRPKAPFDYYATGLDMRLVFAGQVRDQKRLGPWSRNLSVNVPESNVPGTPGDAKVEIGPGSVNQQRRPRMNHLTHYLSRPSQPPATQCEVLAADVQLAERPDGTLDVALELNNITSTRPREGIMSVTVQDTRVRGAGELIDVNAVRRSSNTPATMPKRFVGGTTRPDVETRYMFTITAAEGANTCTSEHTVVVAQGGAFAAPYLHDPADTFASLRTISMDDMSGHIGSYVEWRVLARPVQAKATCDVHGGLFGSNAISPRDCARIGAMDNWYDIPDSWTGFVPVMVAVRLGQEIVNDDVLWVPIM